MIGLDRLMERKGVVAAGQFAPDGKVIRAVGSLSKEQMEEVALSCARMEKQAWVTATELRDGTGLSWGNLNGWILWAGNLALCVSGHTGVFVEAAKADFNQILVDLFGPPAGQHPKFDTSTAPFASSEAAAGSTQVEDWRDFPLEHEDFLVESEVSEKPPRPMMFVKDRHGNGWLCDKGVDPEASLEDQGCWRCEDMGFPA